MIFLKHSMKPLNDWRHSCSPIFQLYPLNSHSHVHVKAWFRTWSTVVAIISTGACLCPQPLLHFLLFCLPPLLPYCTALLLFLWVVSLVHLLVVLPLSDFVTLCYALSIHARQLKVHEMHHWASFKNWFGWSRVDKIFPSVGECQQLINSRHIWKTHLCP